MNRLAPLMTIHAEKHPTFVSRLRYWVLLLLTVGLLQATMVQAQTINTIAGNGTTAYNGEDENGTDDTATAVSLSSPRKAAPAIDASGNVYIADSSHNRIRRVDKNGIITTVAGNGTAGFSGDGGLATSATLNYPTGVAIDSKNNLYIADNQNHRIRKVTTDGKINTVAGTGEAGYNGDNIAATTAQLNTPVSVAIDSAGTTLYIVDKNNQRIRKVTGTTISTVIGNGAASFSGDGGLASEASLNNPEGIAVAANGDLYIADTTNQLIRKVTASDGLISTVAGNGGKAFTGDGGLATEASLNNPAGIAVAANGDLYIADTTNQRIRQVRVSDGIINTVVGNGTEAFVGDGGAPINASLNNPYGITLDAQSNLYIADTNNQRVRKVTAPPVVTVTLKNYTYPTTYGSTVNIGASVSATSSSWTGNYYPDGTVAFKDGSTDIAGCSNVAVNSEDDSGICAANGLSVGSHSITGVYTPSSSSADLFGSATSVPLVLTVNKIVTTTALASSKSTSTYADTVTFTAWVSGSSSYPATGTVTFKDGSTTLCNARLTNTTTYPSKATCSYSALSVGSHSITAVYSGNTNNASSTSNTVVQTVNRKITSTALISSASTVTYGSVVTFTATVNGSASYPATGTVAVKEGSVTLCTASLNTTTTPSKAECSYSKLTNGSHSITATYNGDNNNAISTSPAVSLTVNPPLAISLTSPDEGMEFPTSAKINMVASVSGGSAPIKQVDFYANGIKIGTDTTSPYSYMTSKLANGSHTLKATVIDTNGASKTSASVTITVCYECY